MSVMYATASDLASYLKQDVDTATATLAIQVCSDLFCARAHTRFESTSTTYSQPGVNAYQLILPYQPLISITQVRITPYASTVQTITDYALIGPALYRRLGFGRWNAYPPDLVEVDYIYGYTTVPDDVRGAVLESAGAAYMSPDTTIKQESIDDYSVTSAANTGGFMLSPSAQMLADYYAGALVA